MIYLNRYNVREDGTIEKEKLEETPKVVMLDDIKIDLSQVREG